jgi:DNA-binding NarL/FixJ family response regulator
LGDRLLISQFIVELAEVAAAQGDCPLAARVLGAAEALRESIGATLLPAYVDPCERAVAAARTGLSEEVFAAVWAEGRTMSPEQVLAALKQPAMPPQDLMVPQSVASSSGSTTGMPEGVGPDQSPASTRQETYPASLTEREVEVLRVVALGLTDAQVAERLVLSARTVNSHLRSIYSKLEVSSRIAAVRYALDHDLLP